MSSSSALATAGPCFSLVSTWFDLGGGGGKAATCLSVVFLEIPFSDLALCSSSNPLLKVEILPVVQWFTRHYTYNNKCTHKNQHIYCISRWIRQPIISEITQDSCLDSLKREYDRISFNTNQNSSENKKMKVHQLTFRIFFFLFLLKYLPRGAKAKVWHNLCDSIQHRTINTDSNHFLQNFRAGVRKPSDWTT